MRNRSLVSKTAPLAEAILEGLAADLKAHIGHLADHFENLFHAYRHRSAGHRVLTIALRLFDKWCRESYMLPIRDVAEALFRAKPKGASVPEALAKTLFELGFDKRLIPPVADELAQVLRRRAWTAENIEGALWALYSDPVRKLAAQSAHVLAARILLYRIGEDKDLFSERLSGENLERLLSSNPVPHTTGSTPAADAVALVRREMEGFLPAVYRMGEFDWWYIPDDKRAALSASERATVEKQDRGLEAAVRSLLRSLDSYYFSQIDVDVWRNVYQHYLPSDERQRLGGFYTPDELVELCLDLSEYAPAAPELCTRTFLDPACGSGAFVVSALTRLLDHLRRKLPCHGNLHARGMPEWKRAEESLRIVSRNLHAIDIHPFAAFLTTINVTFHLIDLFVEARKKNPRFQLDLSVFAADSLEKSDEDLVTRDLFEELNSRIQLAEDSIKRYREFLKLRFDFISGNPPWGGVLKGPLSPIFDDMKKRRFRNEYPAAAQGKFDVYGLFLERAVGLLAERGRLALVTQASFIDKEWASGLRRLLAEECRLVTLVDLNPFGQLFFHAMNIPCITVLEKVLPDDAYVRVLMSRTPRALAGSEAERRRVVASAIREALSKVEIKKPVHADFVEAFYYPLSSLKSECGDRWILTPTPHAKARSTRRDLLPIVELLEPSQGVTPGGEGCLRIFLMDEDEALRHGLEKELVRRAVKGKQITKWKAEWKGKVMLYPYALDSELEGHPAFTVSRQSKIRDALDFDNFLDDHEKQVVRTGGMETASLRQVIAHREARGLVQFPRVAEYLVQHYKQLEGRVFKKRNIRSFRRRWYECIWPRDPAVMLASMKILTPRLTQRVRFALDMNALLPQDSCICMLPASKTPQRFRGYRHALSEVLGRRLTKQEVLAYLLAYLNSTRAQEILVTGRRPRPGDVYPITEEYLGELRIPMPRNAREVERIMVLVRACMTKDEGSREREEQELDEVVLRTWD